MGLTNARARVTQGGKTADAGGVQIPYAGAPDGATTGILADEAEPHADDARVSDVIVFEGDVIEVFFFGVMYRHFVNVNANTIRMDRPTWIETKRVRLAIPRDKIQIFAEESR